jgi:hypothetical protein
LLQAIDIYICYQPQFEGDLARKLYAGMQDIHGMAGVTYDVFLDQYDLQLGLVPVALPQSL